MATTAMKLLTIIAEPVLEPRILAQLKAHGASGYTVTAVSYTHLTLPTKA